VFGGFVSAALVAADHVAGSRTSPAQRQAMAIILNWLGLFAWAARRPDSDLGDAVIASAMISTCAGMALRASEWAQAEYRAAIDRRAVACLESKYGSRERG
jgi:hypothetical protein